MKCGSWHRLLQWFVCRCGQVEVTLRRARFDLTRKPEVVGLTPASGMYKFFVCYCCCRLLVICVPKVPRSYVSLVLQTHSFRIRYHLEQVELLNSWQVVIQKGFFRGFVLPNTIIRLGAYCLQRPTGNIFWEKILFSSTSGYARLCVQLHSCTSDFLNNSVKNCGTRINTLKLNLPYQIYEFG